MYDVDIEDDLKQLKALGLDSKMAEYQVELEIRLSGEKVDTGADD